ncbi:methylamine utilization protein MauE, putative [Minicystis rosea]|nr:methylamine utilization protein MauE, putative [Minicystis rosea]
MTEGATKKRANGARTAAFWALRLALGALFVFTGALKLGDPSGFAVEIHNYQLFPSLAAPMAATLPTIELVLGLALIAGPRAWVRGSALATGALMLVFTVAVGSVVVRGINISCGCFGAGSGTVTMMTVLRDVALVAACAAVYALAAPRQRAPEAATSR